MKKQIREMEYMTVYQYEDLLYDIKELGIIETDTILVHSSMKAIGEVQGGADTVLDALMSSVKKGMLLLPTHTWATMTKEHNVYDRDVEPACVGILPNLFRKREGVIRSLHPTHSLAAYGQGAKEFVSGEELQTTPCSRSGCYGKLYDRNAKILLLGCGLNRNTYMHGVEEWFGIKERLTDETLPLKIVMPDGSLKSVNMHKHYKPNNISISEYYVKAEKPFLQLGLLKKGYIGDAGCMVMNAKEIADVCTGWLKENKDVFTDLKEI